MFEEKNIALDVDIPEAPIIIRMDKTGLHRAFSNLIINAYKHNVPGSKVLVQIQVENEEQTKIIIADSGVIIPKQQQET